MMYDRAALEDDKVSQLLGVLAMSEQDNNNFHTMEQPTEHVVQKAL